MIASIAEKARDEGVPVLIVTGDRDAFQLIDPDSRVRVMATARGITETKTYDHQAVIDRYGIAPEQIPDFYGLKGDTSDNIPGVPGIGDKTASELLQRFGDLETVLASIDEISGPKRKQNLTEHADNARVSKQLATMVRDIDVDVDPLTESAREPDRSRLRDVFREFELRDPLRRLEEAFGSAEEAAPAPEAATTVAATVRAGGVDQIASLPDGETYVRRRGAAGPRRRAVRGGRVVAVRRPRGRRRRGRRLRRTGGGCARRSAIDRSSRTTPRSCGVVPPGLAHDTMLGAFLLEPARRGFPLRELCEERGFGSSLDDPLAADAVLMAALAAWQREQIADRGLEAVMADVELPLVAVLRDMEIEGMRLNSERLGAITTRVREEVAPARARDLGSQRRGVRDRARPSSSARSCSRSSACRASAAARPASRPTPAFSRRSVTSTP